ncbi:MAG TPA: hypothetical protein VM103_01190 [Candidatus Paceibacterota bacterium]|nr:hypothetical protein [Candidatus Paceibacterota bacterium]
MTPEEKKLLEETLSLSRENNRMLHALRRSAWIGFIWKVLLWAGFILVPLYLYQQYLGPIFQKFQAFAPGSATTTQPGVFGFPSFAEIQKLIDSYQTKH